jgi:hypothetical protein
MGRVFRSAKISVPNVFANFQRSHRQPLGEHQATPKMAGFLHVLEKSRYGPPDSEDVVGPSQHIIPVAALAL